MGDEMKITTMLAVAAIVFGMAAFSGVAQAESSAACAARCKSYCDKNYAGRGTCMDRCVTKQCNK
jgi:hypothetical protein